MTTLSDVLGSGDQSSEPGQSSNATVVRSRFANPGPRTTNTSNVPVAVGLFSKSFRMDKRSFELSRPNASSGPNPTSREQPSPQFEPGDPVTLKIARDAKLPMTLISAFLFGQRWMFTARDQRGHFWTDFEEQFIKLPYVGTPLKPPVMGARHNSPADAANFIIQGTPIEYGRGWDYQQKWAEKLRGINLLWPGKYDDPGECLRIVLRFGAGKTEFSDGEGI